MPALRSPLRPAIRSALRSPLDYNYGGGFNPASLYAGGKLGLWYEPSDLSTGYQDSAGTTPAALNDFIGKRLDKSGRGNHALQATSGARPTYSARVNLLTKTEVPTDAAIWSVYGAATVIASLDPLGGMTAAQVDLPTLNTGLKITTNTQKTVGVPYVAELWLRADAPGTITLFDGADNSLSASCAVTTEWARFSGFGTALSKANFEFAIYRGSAGELSKVYVWRPQLKFGAVGTTYQRVNTASDYDTVGFPTFLNFDGVNDALSTGAITLGADMDCFIAVRRSSATGILAYTTPGSGVYFGAFDATGSAASAGAGTPTYYVNGVAVPGGTSTTRTQLATALPVGVWSVLEIRNANLSAWTAFANGAYTGFITAEDEAGIILCEAQSTASRNQIRTYLGTKVGLVL